MTARRDDGARYDLARTARLVLCPILALSMIPLSGCTGASSSKEPEVTAEGLVMVRRTRRSHLWVKPDHHLGRYDNVLLDRVGIGYARGQKALDDEQEAQIAQMLQSVIVALTSAGPVGLTAEAGPCVVSINLGLKDLRLYDSKVRDSTSSYVSSYGSATMIIEFVDSISGVLLVRYVASRDLPGGGSTGNRRGVDLNRLGRALGGMVANMNNELRTIVPTTTNRPETQCNDGIYKLTGRG